MQRGPVKRVGPWGVALAASCVVLSARSQAVDIEPASLSAGAPLSLIVRVRPDGTQTAPLPAHCLEAEIVTDGRLLPGGDIRIRTQGDATTGWTRVRLSHPHRQQGPAAVVTLILKCGSTFERQFSVFTNTDAHQRLRSHSERASIRRSVAGGTRSVTAPLVTEASAPLPAVQADGPYPSQAPPPQTVDPPAVNTAVASAGNAERSANTASLALSDATDEPAPGSARAAPVIPNVDPQKLQADLVRLQAEHQRALSQVATLKSRLTHEELSPSRTTWAALMGLLALSLVQLNRWTGNRRPAPRAAARALALPKTAAPALPQHEAVHAPGQRRVEKPDEPRSVINGVLPAATVPGSRWHDADFGRATLSDEGVRPMLREVELLIEQGYPAAATLTLEQHLMSQEGKHPAVLLSLFDLYGDMGQPWNRERVGAQLEALYNVQGPLNGDDAPGATRTTPALEDCRASLDRIVRTWGGSESRSALGSLLLRPAAVEPLPLAAFREAVWLHGLRTELDRPTQPALDSGELTLEPMATA